MKKSKIKQICVLSPGYPTDEQPWFPFVEQLLCALTEYGVQCVVISPQSISKSLTHPEFLRPIYWEKRYKNNIIKIYQPKIVTFSTLKIGKTVVTDLIVERSIIKCFEQLNQKFDAIYGHFWTYGLIASKIGKKYNIPAFVACGESIIPYTKLERNLYYKDYLNGVICVSTKSQNECMELGLCSKDKTIVCPNGIDTELFYKHNKEEARRLLGIDDDKFIVCYVGAFSERKGSKRLSTALNKLENVYSIFIGTGEQAPTCKNCIFAGPLPHEQVPVYLSASDVFVLPTLHEGCCNAIVEALACGLPVISSDLSFNDDILDTSNSLKIDPNNVEEIGNAIITIQEDIQLREKLQTGALNKAKNLSIKARAANILKFMEMQIEKTE